MRIPIRAQSGLTLAVIGVVSILLVVFLGVRVVSADEPTVQASLEASFKFGQEARGTAYRTDWFAKSTFTDSIQFHTVYLTMPTQIITRSIGEGGYTNYESTDLDYTRYPRGFRLISAGGARGPRTLVDTQWYTTCVPGPEVMVALDEFSPQPRALMTIRNYNLSGINLYNADCSLINPKPLNTNEWQTVESRISGSVLVNVLGQGGQEHCATVSWTLPQAQPAPILTSTLPIGSGWQLVSIPQGRRSFRASSLLSDMASQGVTVTQLVRWNNGGWQTHLRGFPVNDYEMEHVRGYFLMVESPGNWAYER